MRELPGGNATSAPVNVQSASAGMAVDGSGNAHVTGATFSTTFPTQDPYQGSSGGGLAYAFIAKTDPYFQVGIPIAYKDTAATSW